MPGRIEWVSRKFTFEFPTDYYPEVLERLRGTPPRAEDRMKGLPPETLTLKPGGAWSILEHIGHLADLEPLLQGRIEDFMSEEKTLRPADMTNQKTEAARHNDHPLETVLAALQWERGKTLERLDGLKPGDFGRTALHPRLKVPMRLVDAMYFHAEHDDYHLARITELIRSL